MKSLLVGSRNVMAMKRTYQVLSLMFALLLIVTPGCSLFKSETEETAAADVIESDPTQWPAERPISAPISAAISSSQAVTLGDLATQQVRIVLPPGALSTGTTVTMTNPENPPPMVSGRGIPLGAPVRITSGDKSTRLNELITITLKYDSFSAASDDVAAVFYNQKTGKWEFITPDKVDPLAETVEFKTDHLSIYGIATEGIEQRIEQWSHNKAIAEITTEQILDKVADRVVDHLLKEQLGLMEYSTKSKVLSGLLKDKEYAKIAKQFSNGDTEGAMNDLAKFAGKKLVEVVESKQLTDALVNAAKGRRFGDAAYEQLRDKIMEGAGETMATRSLKELVGAGEAGKWGVDVNVASEAAGYLREGNVREATRIMGEKIADSFVIGKVGRIATELVRQQINSLKDEKLENAYQAWRTGESGHGYTGDKGNFPTIWNEMKGGLQRQVMIDARAAENEIRRAGGQPPLVPGSREDTAFQARITKELEAQWKARAEEDTREQQIKADLEKLFSNADLWRMMNSSTYFPVDWDKGQKVDAVLKMRDRVLADTAGEILKDKDGNTVRVTNQDIIDLLRAQRGANKAADGLKAYHALLKSKFGISLGTAAVPTSTGTTSAAAGDLKNAKLLVVKGIWMSMAEVTSWLGPSRVGEPINILPNGTTGPSAPSEFSFDSGSIPINWSGSSFSGKLESRREGSVDVTVTTETVNGSVAADGSVSLQYSATAKTTSPKTPGSASTSAKDLVLKNVPLTATQVDLKGSPLTNAISNFVFFVKRTQDGKVWEEERYHMPITLNTYSYLSLSFDY